VRTNVAVVTEPAFRLDALRSRTETGEACIASQLTAVQWEKLRALGVTLPTVVAMISSLKNKQQLPLRLGLFSV
jgi:hypothetical protein